MAESRAAAKTATSFALASLILPAAVCGLVVAVDCVVVFVEVGVGIEVSLVPEVSLIAL